MTELMTTGKVDITTLKNQKLVAACKRIEKATEQTRNSLFRIAYELHRIDANELYKEDGYKNITDTAAAIFGYKKAMTNNLCRIAERYLSATSPVCVLSAGVDGDGVPVSKAWSVGQLQEVLSLSVEEVEKLVDSGKLNATMSAKAIREAVKAYKAERDGVKEEKEEPEKALPPADDSETDSGTDSETDSGNDTVNAIAKAVTAAQKALETLLSVIGDDGADAETLRDMLDNLTTIGK